MNLIMWASRAVGNTATVCSTSVGPVVVNGVSAGCNVWSSIAWETPMIRGSLYGYFTRNGAQRGRLGDLWTASAPSSTVLVPQWSPGEVAWDTRWTPTTGNRPQTPRNGPVVI